MPWDKLVGSPAGLSRAAEFRCRIFKMGLLQLVRIASVLFGCQMQDGNPGLSLRVHGIRLRTPWCRKGTISNDPFRTDMFLYGKMLRSVWTAEKVYGQNFVFCRRQSSGANKNERQH